MLLSIRQLSLTGSTFRRLPMPSYYVNAIPHPRFCQTIENNLHITEATNSKNDVIKEQADKNKKNKKKYWKNKKIKKTKDLNLSSPSVQVLNMWHSMKNNKRYNELLNESKTCKNHPKETKNVPINFGNLAGVKELADFFSKRKMDRIERKYGKKFYVGIPNPNNNLFPDKNNLDDTEIKNNKLKLDSTNGEEITFGTLAPVRDVVDVDENHKSYADYAEEKFKESFFAPKMLPSEYAKKIKELLKEKKLNEALEVLEEMSSVRVIPDLYIYRLLITTCARYGYTAKAFELYTKMKKHGIKPVLKTYTALFNACANCPESLMKDFGLKSLVKLRLELQEKQVILNNIVYHAMIKAYGRCGNIETAFEVVDEMIAMGVYVNTETISFLLQSCLSNEEAGFRHALMVWRRMRQLKIAPTIYAYNLFLEIIEKCKAGDEDFYADLLEFSDTPTVKGKRRERLLLEGKETTFKLLEDEKLEFQDDSSTSSTDITVKEVDQKLPNLLGRNPNSGTIVAFKSLESPVDRFTVCGGSVGFLLQMKMDNVRPDIKTFTKMIKSVPADFDHEMQLLKQMLDNNVQPDTAFFNVWISKCNTNKQADNAKKVLSTMAENHITPDLITYGCVSKGLGVDTYGYTRIQECQKFFDEMNLMAVRPNMKIFYPIIFKSLLQDDYVTAKYLLGMIRKYEIEPSESLIKQLEDFRMKIRNKIIKLEHNAERSKEEEKTLKEMQSYIQKYRYFLRRTQVDLDPHPWQQFNYTPK